MNPSNPVANFFKKAGLAVVTSAILSGNASAQPSTPNIPAVSTPTENFDSTLAGQTASVNSFLKSKGLCEVELRAERVEGKPDMVNVIVFEQGGNSKILGEFTENNVNLANLYMLRDKVQEAVVSSIAPISSSK
jgi:hypothetical protein